MPLIAVAPPYKRFIPGQGLPDVPKEGVLVSDEQDAAIRAIAAASDEPNLQLLGYVYEEAFDETLASKAYIEERFVAITGDLSGTAGTVLAAANAASDSAEDALVSKNAAAISAGDAATSKADAATSAGTATTQAGIATTGAGTATTQAGIATTKAGDAETARAAAVVAKNAAESALALAGTKVINVDATPPTAGEIAAAAALGLTLLWVPPDRVITPTLINPPPPTWNDATSSIVMPSGVVGVDYVWTSGGGGVGETLLQGSTIATSGAFPRSVTITPVAKHGYQLVTSGVTFKHDFPDPAAITILTSDGFSGPADTDVVGRALDLALGGSAAVWEKSSGAGWNIDGSGALVSSGAAGNAYVSLVGANGAKNPRIEVDIASFTGSSSGGNLTGFMVQISALTGATGSVTLGMRGAGFNPQIGVSNNLGGTVYPVGSGDTLVCETGVWTLQMYERTITLTAPSGGVRVYDLADTAAYNLPDENTNKAVVLNNASTALLLSINSFKVSKVGF